jgi:hypothetical protein
MTELDIDSNWYETSFILDGNMLQYVQRICLQRFKLRKMYITDIDVTAFRTFAKYSTCLESLEISNNIIYDPNILLLFEINYFRNLTYYGYFDNNQRVGYTI